MAYDDAKYLEAVERLRSAVYALRENEIEPDDIRDMVEQALDEADE